MATRLSIFNAALTLVSTTTIKQEDLDDVDNPQAAACINLYPSQKTAVLAMAQWPFAIKRTRLEPSAQSDDVPEFEYTYNLGVLKDDSAIVRDIGWVSTVDPLPYEIEGNSLYTDQPPDRAILRYVADVKETLFRGTFIECVEKKLAAQLAAKFRNDEQLTQRILVEYARALQVAQAEVTPFTDLPLHTLLTTFPPPPQGATPGS